MIICKDLFEEVFEVFFPTCNRLKQKENKNNFKTCIRIYSQLSCMAQ